jgi:hypothetical protein
MNAQMVFQFSCALLNPQKASGSGHSLLGSGALPRELEDGLLIEGEKIKIPG